LRGAGGASIRAADRDQGRQQYGFEDLSGQALLAARRNARALIEFAEGVLSH
jgi:hypothetical protein